MFVSQVAGSSDDTNSKESEEIGSVVEPPSGNGDGYQLVSQKEEEDGHPYSGNITGMLDYYDSLELDEDIQMSLVTRQDLGAWWLLGSRASANEVTDPQL